MPAAAPKSEIRVGDKTAAARLPRGATVAVTGAADLSLGGGGRIEAASAMHHARAGCFPRVFPLAIVILQRRKTAKKLLQGLLETCMLRAAPLACITATLLGTPREMTNA